MSVYLAAHSGFCFGVRRAIQLAEEAGKQTNSKVYTLGEIIHNPQTVERLAKAGITVAEKPDELHDSIVIIRSHGITKEEEEMLRANGNQIIDATCPYVKRTHELAAKMNAEGYEVVICGDREHPEVKGMLSYSNDKTQVLCDHDNVPDFSGAKLAVICQTTQKLENLQTLVRKLLPVCRELRVFNTICHATGERQQAGKALASCSDLMIVIGGRKSSNTKMLQSICSAVVQSLHIETALELDESLVKQAQRIGISAGASTPDDLIVQVYNRIKEIKGEPGRAQSVRDIPTFKEESC